MNIIMQFLHAHPQGDAYIAGLISGAIISNPGTCAILFFDAVIKIPGVGKWIAGHPDQAKGWADAFDKAIDAQIEKYAEQNKTDATQK